MLWAAALRQRDEGLVGRVRAALRGWWRTMRGWWQELDLWAPDIDQDGAQVLQDLHLHSHSSPRKINTKM